MAVLTSVLVDGLAILGSTARLATPLFLAALGGLFSERAGIAALGLEGMMLGGAFAAGLAASLTGSPLLGIVASLLAGLGLALLLGVVAIRLKGDQIVAGMALNIALSGICPALCLGWFGEGGNTPALPQSARLLPILFGQTAIVYAAALAWPASWFLLFRTRFGLGLRAVGENPAAVDAAGISVVRLRYAAMSVCGALAGLAGADLAIADGAGFVRDMTAGRGYLALAALILGRWSPSGTAAACLFLALADASQLWLQGSATLARLVPTDLVQMLPYMLTLGVLAAARGRGRVPAALGVAFQKG